MSTKHTLKYWGWIINSNCYLSQTVDWVTQRNAAVISVVTLPSLLLTARCDCWHAWWHMPGKRCQAQSEPPTPATSLCFLPSLSNPLVPPIYVIYLFFFFLHCPFPPSSPHLETLVRGRLRIRVYCPSLAALTCDSFFSMIKYVLERCVRDTPRCRPHTAWHRAAEEVSVY